jgi:hypothetical protein
MKPQLALEATLKLALVLTAAFPASLAAQTTISQSVSANTFVSSGQPTMNFGTLGAMEIAAPTTAQSRTEDSLLQFSTAAIASGFNTDYGTGNWVVSSVTLELFSNVATAGTQPGNSSLNKIAAGEFELDWLSDNNWGQTAITWNTLPGVLAGTGNNLQDSLGQFNWPATGASSTTWALGLDPNMISDIGTGGTVTIFGQPTVGSTVGYLFNTSLMNGAELNVTATQVPEPSALVMIVSSLLGWLTFRGRSNQE